MTATRTRVYFTVDVECAEERTGPNGLVPPVDYDVRVWGRFANCRRELGIGLLMDELEAEGFLGTFFVEVLGSHYFGTQGLQDVVHGVRDRGHDVQLHLHPVLRNAAWKSSGRDSPVEDNIGAYTLEQQSAMLAEGVALLAAAGVPRDEIVAYRAGNFGANNATWEAMAKTGLRIASNYNPAALQADCMVRPTAPRPDLFESGVADVWELPISNFVEPGGGFRPMQLCAASLAEMIYVLEESARTGIEHVTLVTHSFELFYVDSLAARRAHVDHVTFRRLRGLLRFLGANRDRFEVTTVGQLAHRLPPAPSASEPPRARVRAAYPREPRLPYYRRLVEQGVRRIAARVPFP